MAHPKGADHLSSPNNMDVIDVDSDNVRIQPHTPLKESDIAKLISKRDKLLKAIANLLILKMTIIQSFHRKNHRHSNHQQLIY